MKTYLALIIALPLLAVAVGLVGTIYADAGPRDNCECRELKAIRRILEQQFRVVCDERRCLPTPTGTPDGSELP